MPKEKVIKGDKSILDQKISDLEKRYGAGTIISGSSISENLEVISSGSLTLNIASNIGGIPVGKLLEWMGLESSGKSTLTLHAIAEFQKAGRKCVLADSEQSFDRTYAEALGVQMDKLIIIQPECMEDAYNVIQELIETGEVGLVVIDSHTSLMPKRLVEGEVGDSTIGLQARINSSALGKLKPLLRYNKCTIIAISQIRQNIGGYGDPNISTGGLAYKFYSDMRFKFSKSVDKDAEMNKTTVEIIKSKCGSPFGKAEFRIVWGVGIDKEQEIIDYAVELGLITKGGSWYTIEGDLKIQGDESLKEHLKNNPEYLEKLKEQVLLKLKS